MPKHRYISKYASMLNRLSNAYFDDVLHPYNIGGGQQFFLTRIYEEDGISVLDLANKGAFDKGTTARAIQKLEDMKYVKRIHDEHDKRIHRLYHTALALPAIKATYQAIEDWNTLLGEQLSEAEMIQVELLMGKLAQNAVQYMKDRKKEGKI